MSIDSMYPSNCQACSKEFLNTDLSTIKLSGMDTSIVVCESCSNSSAEKSFKGAADIVKDIIAIASSDKKAESRLNDIRALIGE